MSTSRTSESAVAAATRSAAAARVSPDSEAGRGPRRAPIPVPCSEGGGERFLAGPVGGGADLVVGRLLGQFGPALGLAADPLVFVAQSLLGPPAGGLLGFAAEAFDQGVDPLGGLLADLLGALHDPLVDLRLDLGNALAGEYLELVGVGLGLSGAIERLAGAFLVGLDPVGGFAFGCLARLAGEPLGGLLEVAGAGCEPLFAFGGDLAESPPRDWRAPP